MQQRTERTIDQRRRLLEAEIAHVGRVQVDPCHRGRQRGTERAGPTAQVHHDCSRAGQRGGLVDEELGATAGDEHPGLKGNAQTAELGPTQNLFEWPAADSLPGHRG